MNRLARSSPHFTALLGASALLIACSAATSEENAARTSEGITYAPLPPDRTAFGAADLENAYTIPTWINAGTTIAIVTSAGDDPSSDADLAVYRSAFALPPCTASSKCLTTVTETGATTNFPVAKATTWDGIASGRLVSTALDMASAGCPTCKLLVVEMTGVAQADFTAAVTTAKALGASSIVMLPALNSALLGLGSGDSALASQGVTLFASASPASVADYTLLGDYPASSPDVISVGVTNLTIPPSTMNTPTDTASSTGASFCSNRAKPSWQTDTACSTRTVNDMAITGGPVWTFNTFYPNGPLQVINGNGWVIQGNVDNPNQNIVAASLAGAIFAQTATT